MIWALVLAAGASSRMGAPKALVRAPDGRRFVDAVVETARAGGCGGVVVVLGPPHGEAIRRALPAGAAAAWNPEPARGMLSSVQAGLAALPPEAEAALVWPVDVPLVRPETVQAVVAAAPGRIVVPVHGGRGGHPLRLPRARFAAALALASERGLKALLDAHRAEVVRLPVDDRAVLVDVDTPRDLAALPR